MSQKIVTLCDVHQHHDEEVPGVGWTITLHLPGDSRPTSWEVDLCADDAKGLTDLAALLDEVGRRTEGPRKAPAAPVPAAPTAAPTAKRRYGGSMAPSEAPRNPDGSYPCPVEGCTKVPNGRKALMSHLRQYHDGLSIAEATGQPTPYACGAPGCDRSFSHAQGRAAHRTSAHPELAA